MNIATSQCVDVLNSVSSQLDRSEAVHLYRQLAALMRGLIESQQLPAGTPLPSQRELSTMWDVGQVTIRRALRELAREGLLDARPGSGTVVLDPLQARQQGESSARVLTIGVAFADLLDGYPFFRPILQGLRADGGDVSVRLFDMPRQAIADAGQSHTPNLAELDGLIMMTPINLGLLAACQRRRLPTVLMFTDLSDGFSHCLYPDYTQGVVEAVMALHRGGRRRVALVTAGDERPSTGRWIEAYRGAMLASGLKAVPSMLAKADYSEASAAEATRQLLAASPRPDAILYASDVMARGGLLAAHAAGLSVPKDLAIVGAGPLLDEGGWTEPLTSIDLGLVEMGRRARNILGRASSSSQHHPLRQAVASHLRLGRTH